MWIVLFLVAAVIGLVYVIGVFLIMLLAAVVSWIARLGSRDANEDPAHARWVAANRRSGALEFAFRFGVLFGVVGLVIGLGQSVQRFSSIDGGTVFSTAIAWAVIGALIGAFLGYESGG